MMLRRSFFLVLLVTMTAAGSAQAALSDTEVQKLLAEIDSRRTNNGDYKSLVYIEQKRKGRADLLYEAVVYRRDADKHLVILFTKPTSEAGKGYLRLNKNLFLYDPNVGKWDRRTERERIGGTSSRRSDFDGSRLAEEFDAKYAGDEKLGKFDVHHLVLHAKEGADVAYPTVHVWVDVASKNILKQQEHALSDRLMRTVYYPEWTRIYSETKKDYIHYPREIRIYDEVEKDNQSLIVLRKVDLRPLDPNIFTKAWLESKSR